MKVKGIIYDFDGVICDSVNVKTEAFSVLYESYGSDVQQQVIQYHLDHGGISRFDKIRHYHNHILQQEISEEDVTTLANRFASLVKEKVIASAYIKEADTFIEKHNTNILQFICTGTPEFEILEITERRGIAQFFNGIYGAPKKKAQIIQNILTETGLQPTDFVFFGDAMTDYDAARECSVPFIGIFSTTTVFPEGTKVVSDFAAPELTALFEN